MSEKIGIIKEIDNLGRLTVPKELRTLFNLNDKVELVITENGILLRNPKYRLVKIQNKTNTQKYLPKKLSFFVVVFHTKRRQNRF